MPGLDHFSSPSEGEDESLDISARNARYGMVLFLVYLAVYCAYVGLNTFKPEVMGSIPFWGVNLAVVYGFGLIVLALVLALVYAWLCRAASNGPDATSSTKESV